LREAVTNMPPKRRKVSPVYDDLVKISDLSVENAEKVCEVLYSRIKDTRFVLH
jgi:polyhydroxyalkanoate synthesis regulator phasin